MRIALVHDWILGMAGDIRVLQSLHEQYPEAPIYCLFYTQVFTDTALPQAEIRTSFLQKTFQLIKDYRYFLPLIPAAVESFDLSEFDVVISTGSAYAKGIVVPRDTIHINYCHSPTRQYWDRHVEYRGESKHLFNFPRNALQHVFRIWDRQASLRPDFYIANSEHIKKRITKYYRKKAVVITPPVATPHTKEGTGADYFLIVSRLHKHKNIDIAINTCTKHGWPLVIIGSGPEEKSLRKIAGPNVSIKGSVDELELTAYYASCKAFIMPQEEDFGIAPLEAMAHGKPVLALRRGGAIEYVMPGINGELFDQPVEGVLAEGIMRLNAALPTYNPALIKSFAMRYSPERFKQEIAAFISTIHV